MLVISRSLTRNSIWRSPEDIVMLDHASLIVQTPQPSPDSGGDPVHDLLGEAGYVVERCLHGAHRELHVARRRATPEPRLAA